jgi:hypothetical protein
MTGWTARMRRRRKRNSLSRGEKTSVTTRWSGTGATAGSQSYLPYSFNSIRIQSRQLMVVQSESIYDIQSPSPPPAVTTHLTSQARRRCCYWRWACVSKKSLAALAQRQSHQLLICERAAEEPRLLVAPFATPEAVHELRPARRSDVLPEQKCPLFPINLFLCVSRACLGK